MPMVKRLFLFAGYDKNGIIDDALIYYMEQLHKFGDVILCMDSDCKKTETDKVKRYCIHVIATQHGEYDFGSYKRAYIFAQDNHILNDYDIVYLLNDSVFGPTINLYNTLQRAESSETNATGLVVSKHRTHKFMESWFIKLDKKIFTAAWFNKFITSVKHEKNKADITVKYEHGLSNLILSNHLSWGGIYVIWGRYTYNHPKQLFNQGCPFIKRASFTRHNGAIGGQIKYILEHCDKRAKNAILQTAYRIYGTEYMNWLLTENPFKIFLRKVKYAAHKIFGGRK